MLTWLFILLIISVIALFSLGVKLDNTLKENEALQSTLKEKTEALDEAYEVLIGNKEASCSLIGHDLVQVKKTLSLDIGTHMDFAPDVWIKLDSATCWTYKGLTGVKNTNSADLQIAFCKRCKKVIPLSPIQIELLPEYKELTNEHESTT